MHSHEPLGDELAGLHEDATAEQWRRMFDALGESLVKYDIYYLERGLFEGHVINGLSALRRVHPLPQILRDWIHEYAERAQAHFGWPPDWRLAHEEELMQERDAGRAREDEPEDEPAF